MQWLPDVGVGFLEPQEAFDYGADYFANYQTLADGDIARQLNAARVAMLKRHVRPHAEVIIDVGIGAGTFIEAAEAANLRVFGYDINPRGVEWLVTRKLLRDPFTQRVDVACFWDALEHIANPTALLANVTRAVLVSLPIFRDASHVRASKHYKPGEHIWYFTEPGIRWFMDGQGFACVGHNTAEMQCGREDIHSFAFVRA